MTKVLVPRCESSFRVSHSLLAVAAGLENRSIHEEGAMSRGLSELIAERAQLADQHDHAKANWQLADPQFAQAVQPLALALSRVVDDMLQIPEAPTIEVARSYMWLGDALFDLAQGRHNEFGPALQAYRAAEPYVRVTRDATLSAKYDANFANIQLRSVTRIEHVQDVVRRYERALPQLRLVAPPQAARVEVELAQAQRMLVTFQALEQEMQKRRAELVEMIPKLSVDSLDPQRAAAITALATELSRQESGGDLTQASALIERIRVTFQEMMRHSEPDHPGVAGRIARTLMKLWSELTALAFTVGTDAEVRTRAFEVQQDLLLAKFELTAAGDVQRAHVFATRVLPVTARARALLALNHLTWVSPIWPISDVVSALGVYVTHSVAREELASVAQRYGLEHVVEQPGRELAEARFGALRRAAVVIADVRDAELLPATCYEIGIALVLGKPIVVVGTQDMRLPFDIDIAPVVYDGSALARDALAEAIERALILPQRPADAGGLHGLVDAVRRQFGDLPHYVDLLAASVQNPLTVPGVLDQLVRADAEAGNRHAVVLPAWVRQYSWPEAPLLFHVMPFRPSWADDAKRYAAAACDQANVPYLRGDDARDQRIVRAIWDDVCRSTHTLVDVTDLNPNVCLELGVAHTLGKHTLVVCQPSTVNSLFPMIKQLRVTPYKSFDELARLVAAFIGTKPPVARMPPHRLDGKQIELAMRQQIADAIRHEESTQTFAQHLLAASAANRTPATNADVATVISRVRGYVEGVPILLEAARAAASHTAVAHPVVWRQSQPLFDNAVTYFKEPNDFIADAAGLAGLVDDAYVAYGFIAAASQRCFESTGSHLIQFPTTVLEVHADVRALLGDMLAAQLDGYIAGVASRPVAS